jgi:flagellar biosynthetic protein FlhB
VADKSQRTEKPTPKHKKEMRDKGNVARSPELASWASMLLIVSALPSLIGGAVTKVSSLFQDVLLSMTQPSPAAAIEVLAKGLGTVASASLPILLLCTVIGTGISFAQVGLRLTPKALMPQFSRISPKAGLTRIVSPKGAWTLGKTLLKMSVLAGMGYVMLHQLLATVLGGATLPLPTTMAAVSATTLALIRDIGAIALVIAGADYAVQRRTYQASLRMTKQEIKDEFRKQEGSPEVKRNVRRKARQLSRFRMLAAVASADVVVTNPTHFAVAIAYDRATDRAPRVVAKGQDANALRIRSRAIECSVPVVENPILARTLHAACEVDDAVPPRLYEAVAQLLAFVYSLTPAAKMLRDVHRMDHLVLRLAG